jgi:hypothetical protein
MDQLTTHEKLLLAIAAELTGIPLEPLPLMDGSTAQAWRPARGELEWLPYEAGPVKTPRPEDVELLPRRACWYLDHRSGLSVRERRKLRRRPELRRLQRAWVAGWVRRINLRFKQVYAARPIEYLYPKNKNWGRP